MAAMHWIDQVERETRLLYAERQTWAMLDTLKEAHRMLGSMIFMAEAAEHHDVAYGDIPRAQACRDEIEALLESLGEDAP